MVSRLKFHIPSMPVLILTMHDEEQYVVRAVEAGAMGYVTKQAAPEQLVDAVKGSIQADDISLKRQAKHWQ